MGTPKKKIENKGDYSRSGSSLHRTIIRLNCFCNVSQSMSGIARETKGKSGERGCGSTLSAGEYPATLVVRLQRVQVQLLWLCIEMEFLNGNFS
jgi:hypothetical protein